MSIELLIIVFLAVGCIVFIPMYNLIKKIEVVAYDQLDQRIGYYDALREHIKESREITEKYQKIRMQEKVAVLGEKGPRF